MTIEIIGSIVVIACMLIGLVVVAIDYFKLHFFKEKTGTVDEVFQTSMSSSIVHTGSLFVYKSSKSGIEDEADVLKEPEEINSEDTTTLLKSKLKKVYEEVKDIEELLKKS